MVFIFLIQNRTNTVVPSCIVPNSFLKRKTKNNLEPSIISNAPFTATFLEIILSFQKCQNTPLGASFSGRIKLKHIRKHLKFEQGRAQWDLTTANLIWPLPSKPMEWDKIILLPDYDTSQLRKTQIQLRLPVQIVLALYVTIDGEIEY